MSNILDLTADIIEYSVVARVIILQRVYILIEGNWVLKYSEKISEMVLTIRQEQFTPLNL